MNLLIVATRDKRNRHTFISKPLSILPGFKLNVFNKKSHYLSYLLHSLICALKSKDLDYVIICGGNFTALWWLVLTRIFIRSKFVLRLGGDILEIKMRKLDALSSHKNLSYYKLRLNHFFTKLVLVRIDILIVVNQFIGNEILKKLNRDIPVYVIPQPVEISDGVQDKDSVEKSDMYLLTVTNLAYRDKFEGIQRVIKAMLSNFRAHEYNFKIIYDILGGGPYEHKLKHFLESYGINFKNLEINIHGYIEDTENYYRRADIFIYCSNLDGLPNVILEAQSHGLPLLINTHDPFLEFLEENKHALFFDANSIDDFDQKLRELIADKDLRKKLGWNNRQTIEYDYTIEAIAKKWETFLGLTKGNAVDAA